MALRSCSECGREVSDQAVTCPHCGARVAVVRRANVATALLIVFAALVIGWMLFTEYQARKDFNESYWGDIL